MSSWIDLTGAGNHCVQLLENGGVLWKHDTPDGYRNGSFLIKRHEVSPVDGQTWTVVQREPLTLSPSLHSDASIGGCGMHGHITDGRWS